jgi:Vacuolar protein sorting-associated protein 62
VSVGAAGGVWATATAGHVFRRDAALAEWQMMPGLLRKVEVGSMTAVFGVDLCSGTLLRWTGSSFDDTGELVDEIAANTDSVLWTITENLVHRVGARRLSATPVRDYKKLWDNRGNASSAHGEPLSVFRPLPPDGYRIVGDCIERTHMDTPFSCASIAVAEIEDDVELPLRESASRPTLLKPPIDYELVCTLGGDAAMSSSSSLGVASSNCVSIWRPVPPDGFAALGCVASASAGIPPPLDLVRCCNLGMLVQGRVRFQSQHGSLWRSKAIDVSLWAIDSVRGATSPGTFLASASDVKPPIKHFCNLQIGDSE